MKETAKPAWAGRTVVCIASGPSLLAEDCDLVRQSGHPVAVTNTTFRMAPWADVVFGMDSAWWKQYGKEVAATCTGRRLSTSQVAPSHGAESLYGCSWFPHTLNSGAAIVDLAIVSGAARVILLGYDCQKTGGKTHWHGDHPSGLGNARTMKNWPRYFSHVAKKAKDAGCPVLNASRSTALTCFPRVLLEDVLAEQSEAA